MRDSGIFKASGGVCFDVDKKDFVNELAYNTNIQKNIENKISTLLTDNIKYSYLLYKDKKGVFRFLADATVGEEKAKFNQKFDIDGPFVCPIKTESLFVHRFPSVIVMV